MPNEFGVAGARFQTQRVIGRCAYAAPGVARFEPVLVAASAAWRPIQDPRAMFPDVGTVFSPEILGVLPRVGSLWVFTTDPHRKYERGRGHDQYVARDLHVPVPLLDYTALREDEVRRQLVEVGLTDWNSSFEEVVVRIRSDACVRLQLFVDEATGRSRADLIGLDDLPIFRCEAGVTAGADIGGIHFVVPGHEPNEVLDRVDWSPDHEFLPRILKRIRRASRDGQAREGIFLTNNAIEAIASFARSGGILSNDADSLRRMRRRLEEFLPRYRSGFEDLEGIVGTLRAFKPVADTFEDEVAARRVEIDASLRASLEPVVRGELERRHAAASDRIDAALKEAAEAESMEADARAHLDLMRRAADEVEAILVQELGVIHDIIESSSGDHAEKFRALASRFADALVDTGVQVDILVPASPPWASGFTRQTHEIGLKQLRERFDAQADSSGLDTGDLLVLDALLRSGELVLVVDDDIQGLLDSYAQCVTGGNVRRIALDPSVIGLDDLWRQPATGSPTSFAQAWTAARAHPDRAILLAIESIEAAPLGLWLPALLRELHGRSRPTNLLVAATVCPARWSDRHGASRLVGQFLPFAAAAAADAWIRAAFRATGHEQPLQTTSLNVSPRSQLSSEAAGMLVTRLNEVAGLRPSGAMRAARVFQAADSVGFDALELALDVARLASTRGEASTSSEIKTSSLARAMSLFDEAAKRATH